jgi:hypothetical protein
LTPRVLEQTKARVLKGDTPHPPKVRSVFETHTEAIRKGKKVKPTEFGKRVKEPEAEKQFVTDYQVGRERVPDAQLWEARRERQEPIFGGPPHWAIADAAFSSAANEQAAAITRSAARGADARDARGESVPSNHGTASRHVVIAASKRWNVG